MGIPELFAATKRITYFTAQVEDRLYYLEMTYHHFYGKKEWVPISWEENGQVFIGEMSMEDVADLELHEEKLVPIQKKG